MARTRTISLTRRSSSSSSIRRIALFSILLVLLCFSGVVYSEKENTGENVKESAKLLDALDSNGDGKIDKNEFESGMNALKTLFLDKTSNLREKASKLKAKIKSKIHKGKDGKDGADGEGTDDDDAIAQGFWKAFTSSLAMIIATEIGDKTFFIAAVLSMKHARSAVFAGAILALIIMTILSTFMGLVLPQFMPRKYTHILGGILFFYFGVKLLLESRGMKANQVSEELAEVEEELLQQRTKKDEEDNNQSANDDDEETGKANNATSNKNKVTVQKKKHWYGIALQALTLTFLAEWGDRSQIATIALAAAKNPYGVTVGGCLGHSICTGGAVIGGRMLAKSISEKTVTYYGGLIFLVFGIHSLFFES